jgi:hypothetical protein
VEPGSALRIAGDGFPVARDAMVVLVGQLARPGNAPLDVNHTLRGHARSEQLIEVPLGEPDLTALGGRGTFTGSLHITFSGIASRRDVAGSVDGVEFDLRLSADGGLHDALERGERAEAALDELGITPADEQSPSGGLRIGEVRPDSAAARATLTAGDVLVRFDGVRVLELSDLAPRPGVLRVTLEVERPGTSQPTTLEMPLRGPPEGQKGRVLLMLVLLGALVVFVASVPATSGPLTLFVRDAVDVKAPHAIDWLLGYAPGTRVGNPAQAALAVAGAGPAGRERSLRGHGRGGAGVRSAVRHGCADGLGADAAPVHPGVRAAHLWPPRALAHVGLRAARRADGAERGGRASTRHKFAVASAKAAGTKVPQNKGNWHPGLKPGAASRASAGAEVQPLAGPD